MISRFLQQQERRSRLFGEMFRRFTSDSLRDLTMGDELILRQAAWRCRGCAATARCEAWMAATSGTAGAGQFCPNVELFRKLGDRPAR